MLQALGAVHAERRRRGTAVEQPLNLGISGVGIAVGTQMIFLSTSCLGASSNSVTQAAGILQFTRVSPCIVPCARCVFAVLLVLHQV